MSGHYVYHWLNESGVWYTFDDSEAKPWKESRQNSAKTDFPLFGHGYIYLYERVTDSFESVVEDRAKDAATKLTADEIENKLIDQDYKKGGRLRTRKNKRRITKRKVNKNKNKTKGKNRKH